MSKPGKMGSGSPHSLPDFGELLNGECDLPGRVRRADLDPDPGFADRDDRIAKADE
jgi:hypothetical protein